MTTIAQAPDSHASIFQRFDGDRGRMLAIAALREQRIILGNAEAAQELCARGRLEYYMPGGDLMVEDEWSNSVFFIIAGSVKVSISGNAVAHRTAGQHVGEMALIDPGQPRSATVTAVAPTVALIVSEEDFAAVAAHHPDLWRQIAKEMATRLRQRNNFIRPSNHSPLVFIACAAESLKIAGAMKAALADAGVTGVKIWTDGVFKPSQHTMESLSDRLAAMDFAIAIFSPDDEVVSRGEQKLAPRDNTVFELGLFAGAIGRDRSFYAVPREIKVKIPSDLAGITSVRYGQADGQEPDVEDACESIIARIRELGPR
ncbi:hypothetical protein SS05631_c17110 [Sinorhizobium sp. CCBAU 05631]|nr:hypothetical protein SS05631_c17110 [Sinorhizobium sp. CCBAU 05631]